MWFIVSVFPTFLLTTAAVIELGSSPLTSSSSGSCSKFHGCPSFNRTSTPDIDILVTNETFKDGSGCNSKIYEESRLPQTRDQLQFINGESFAAKIQKENVCPIKLHF